MQLAACADFVRFAKIVIGIRRMAKLQVLVEVAGVPGPVPPMIAGAM
jgi:hypothetical protein